MRVGIVGEDPTEYGLESMENTAWRIEVAGNRAKP